jgi:hypothetical protein
MAAGRRSVVWAESARAALDDVVTSIAQDSRETAVRVLVAALDAASHSISTPSAVASFPN